MARTNDPGAATKKAWLTRARAAGGGGVVQQRGDFGVVEETTREALAALLKSEKMAAAPRSPEQKGWEARVGRNDSGILGWGYVQDRPPTDGERQELELAIRDAPPYRAVVYRGSRRLPGGFKIGEVFTLANPKSATRSPDVAKAFSGADPKIDKGQRIADAECPTILKIHTKTAAAIENVVADKHRVEREVVLRRGTQYRVLRVQNTFIRRYEWPGARRNYDKPAREVRKPAVLIEMEEI